MSESKEIFRKSIKAMVFAQSFVEVMDEFEGSNHYKHQLKNKGNSFTKEVDKFLDSVYEKGGADNSMIDLIEACQKAIDKVIDDNLQLKA